MIVASFSRGLLLAVALFAFACPAFAAALAGEQAALHVLNRLGYGPRPGDVARVAQMGVDRYIDEQLRPETIPLPDDLRQALASLTTRRTPTGELVAKYRAVNRAPDPEEARRERRELTRRLVSENGYARLTRALESPRQLEEVMVEFWFNHFNVFQGKGLDVMLVGDYEEQAIRPHVLGRFRDLLGATAHHPAMLFYLDNWLSVAATTDMAAKAPRRNGLNENYARELMELHTLGVDGGYTQKDVTELARMLTGWTFVSGATLGSATFYFDSRRHDTGEKRWLGRQVADRGQAEGEWALDVLASHPATARHIGSKLAQYFVSDTPPHALVDALAKRFLDTHGDIREVLRTLFQSREFRDAAVAGAKFKTPYHYVVSAARAAGVKVTNAAPLQGMLSQLGMPLYGCQTPDGYKNTEAAWLNGEAMTRRINFATALASGRLPLSAPRDAQAPVNARQMESATDGEMQAQRVGGAPVDAGQLQVTLGTQLSPRTLKTVASADPGLRAALILGSPDFMRR